ncbi:hypothetical protein RN001_012497 [Aquatica leii]|uniref:Signal recognition particle receptor subunit beta n=1 Tax=Aquatica leii TaxID=1421715 RepID=A0AAN7SPI4_9COLE|nr:hypothetical protein RN001_012497 [Aquatica leii]
MDSKSESKSITEFSSIITFLIVFGITLIFVIFFLRRKSSKRGVLLTGLCDSGKTLIFAQLVHGKYTSTQTSMKENLGDYLVKNVTLRLIDIPGHERLRDRFFDQYKSVARGIMYVVDSVTLQKNVKDAAECLYNILSECMGLNNLSVLIICNKQDLPLAKTSTVVKSMLEKELNALRITKSSQLESVDQKTNKAKMIGKVGENFNFSHLPFDVKFVEASVSSEHKNTNDMEMWLTTLCS